MKKTILQLKNITKRYKSPDVNADSDNPVLRGIDLLVSADDAISISGPSGCGKSTLLNIMGLLDTPTSGEIIFQNTSITTDPSQLAKMRSEKIGFIFQLHHLLPQCTVLENVLLPTLALNKPDKNALLQRAKSLLEGVGLTEHSSYHPAQLSGGQCQRVALVRSLINSPSLILADEPTGSLDQQTALKVTDLLLDLKEKENFALVMVTHSTQLAQKMQNRYELVSGKLEGLS